MINVAPIKILGKMKKLYEKAAFPAIAGVERDGIFSVITIIIIIIKNSRDALWIKYP